jgi:hypothetical protein
MVHPDKIWNVALECYIELLSKETHDGLVKLKADI